ncbi:MAG: UDP-N-acetylmuramoyl-L-alanine--D-glutamate ligase [Helicobacteraceae bacterium]|jgi:UDP-N-acetylmuramoylalanine--D-glutamate ligase|nr:UDP-N-acetylmuramoyl-L-alanine--D-glutamate ligase [Helicobacteraceae bacterium]
MQTTLFGYGKTNAAIAKRFGNCEIFDDKFKQVETFGENNKLLPMDLFDPDKSTMEVVSPGIAPSHPQVKRAKNLISEYDLFCECSPFSIWISGTNGKTTTTEMVGLLLKNKGAIIGGNIGAPLAELDMEAKIWALETSSFTLHYTTRARPNIYALLPITPDHISWHGSFEAYETAKLKPLRWLAEGELAIIPAKYRHIPTKAFVCYYENNDDLTNFFDIDATRIKFQGCFLQDALIALGIAKALFDETDYNLLNSFVVDKHKIEEFFDKSGRLWIDDSKATNYDATLQAIEIYKDRLIHLILGGDDKGADLTPLFDRLKDMRVVIYAIGSNRDRIIKMAQERNIEAVLCGFLDIAVAKIADRLDKNGVALLSPAAASLDQFSGYKERGELFKKYVGDLN